MFQQIIENWLRSNYQYEVRSISLPASTVISINHMDNVGLELFYDEEGRLTIVWERKLFAKVLTTSSAAKDHLGFSTSHIYYSDPDMFDKLRSIISKVEENHAILIS